MATCLAYHKLPASKVAFSIESASTIADVFILLYRSLEFSIIPPFFLSAQHSVYIKLKLKTRLFTGNRVHAGTCFTQANVHKKKTWMHTGLNLPAESVFQAILPSMAHYSARVKPVLLLSRPFIFLQFFQKPGLAGMFAII